MKKQPKQKKQGFDFATARRVFLLIRSSRWVLRGGQLSAHACRPASGGNRD